MVLLETILPKLKTNNTSLKLCKVLTVLLFSAGSFRPLLNASNSSTEPTFLKLDFSYWFLLLFPYDDDPDIIRIEVWEPFFEILKFRKIFQRMWDQKAFDPDMLLNWNEVNHLFKSRQNQLYFCWYIFKTLCKHLEELTF